jgi:hypothetical protein
MGLFNRLFGRAEKRPLIDVALEHASAGRFAEARQLANQVIQESADKKSEAAMQAQSLLDRLDGIATIHGKQSDALAKAARNTPGDMRGEKPRISMKDQKPDRD